MRSKLVSFGIRSIQKGRRLSFHDSLLQNLGVQMEDPVEVLFDSAEKAVAVRKAGTTGQKNQRGVKD